MAKQVIGQDFWPCWLGDFRELAVNVAVYQPVQQKNTIPARLEIVFFMMAWFWLYPGGCKKDILLCLLRFYLFITLLFVYYAFICLLRFYLLQAFELLFN
jgi:hypothetical protein